MPELPEVATWRRLLQQGGPQGPSLVHELIHQAHLLLPRQLVHPEPARFPQILRGQTIRALGRRGKYLLVYLDRGVLLVHLGMSGSFAFVPLGEPFPRHTRWALDLASGWRWCFVDPRTFGRVAWYPHPWHALSHLGPEPLSSEFTWKHLAQQLQGRRAAIKSLLLNQGLVAGVGNIYADEALHRAGLHPETPAGALRSHQIQALWKALREVLGLGLRHRGATFDSVYPHGQFQNHFRVYGRAGQPCYTCGTPIQRIRLAGRGTHFCPRCQPTRIR